jgi:hypothetical protein
MSEWAEWAEEFSNLKKYLVLLIAPRVKISSV